VERPRDPVIAYGPGRVNLIGEHTDTSGGLALPMAIQLGTTVSGARGGDRVVLRSDTEPEPADVPLDVEDPSAVSPGWARYVAGVVAELRPAVGFAGTVSTTLPVGAGLSSSAALEVAVALALADEASAQDRTAGEVAVAVALACQRAEQRASGVPCGVMDQLASAAGVAGHALLIDCRSLEITPVAIPEGAAVVAVHSGQARTLAGSEYAERRAAVEAAERVVGPLRDVTTLEVLDQLADPVLRRRARHVVTENERVRTFVDALRAGELDAAGQVMAQSHASLRDDFEVSTPRLDELCAELAARPGVFGVRLTGAGFGGCVVALTRPGALDVGWTLHPSAGASVSRS
jgi:galactokinase